MNEIVSLDQLALEIRYYSQQTALSIIEVGKRLIEAKKQVAHGEWENWLKGKVNFTRETASRFMKCAERYSNVTSISLLNPTQMITLLSLPESETEIFIEQKKAEGNPVEDMTVKTLREEIKEWKSKAEQAKNEAFAANNDKRRAELRAEQTERSNDMLRKENTGLKDTIRQQADELATAGGDSELQIQLETEKNKRMEAEQQIEWLRNNPVEPKDYRANKRRIEELESEVATYKAHEEGMTLRQKSEIDEKYSQYRSNFSEISDRAMKVMDLITIMGEFPQNLEIADFAECYIRRAAGAEARATADIEKLIVDLQVLHDGLENYVNKSRRLQVVK